jgi:hypothetical protein
MKKDIRWDIFCCLLLDEFVVEPDQQAGTNDREDETSNQILCTDSE